MDDMGGMGCYGERRGRGKERPNLQGGRELRRSTISGDTEAYSYIICLISYFLYLILDLCFFYFILCVDTI